MSKLWIAAGLLAAMVAGAVWNQQGVLAISGEVQALLEQADRAMEADDRSGARAAVEEAVALWESKAGYLNAVLRHSETDQICVGLHEALQHLDSGTFMDFAAATMRINQWIRILCEMEAFSLSNLL